MLSLNMRHSEKNNDVFRYCIRKDPFLAKHLDQQTDGIDKSPTTVIDGSGYPVLSRQFGKQKPSSVRIGNNSGRIKRGRPNLLAEFVDCQAACPTYSFNDLRNELYGVAKIQFDEKELFWLESLK